MLYLKQFTHKFGLDYVYDYGNITQYVTKDPKNDTIIERTEYKYQEMK